MLKIALLGILAASTMAGNKPGLNTPQGREIYKVSGFQAKGSDVIRAVSLIASNCTRKTKYQDQKTSPDKACRLKMYCDIKAKITDTRIKDMAMQIGTIEIQNAVLDVTCPKKAGACPSTEELCIADAQAETDGTSLANEIKEMNDKPAGTRSEAK
jgi:hypothetical protein